MKSGSDNYRASAVQGIMKRLENSGINLVVFEPSLKGGTFFGHPVEKELPKFKELSDLIVANRISPELEDVKDKVFSRDLFFYN